VSENEGGRLYSTVPIDSEYYRPSSPLAAMRYRDAEIKIRQLKCKHKLSSWEDEGLMCIECGYILHRRT